MGILFLSDGDDQILKGAYEHISRFYPCEYATNDSSLNSNHYLVITNHCIPQVNSKVIYYATRGLSPKDNTNRRIMQGWLSGCKDIICSSMAISKNLYDVFRIQSSVQYPVIQEQNSDQINIVYSNNFIGIDVLRNELPNESLVSISSPYDVVNAKVYLSASKDFLDLGMCIAATCGIPIVLENNPNLNEFLDAGDVVIMPNTSMSQRIQTIKRALKEYRMKSRSRKFLEAPVLEDKIKQALAKKPTSLPLPAVLSPRRNAGKRSGIQVNQPPPPAPSPPPTPIKALNKNTIYVRGSVVGISGYDNTVREIIRGLKSLDLDVRINSYSSVDYDKAPPYFKEILMPRPPEAWQIIIAPPCNIDRHEPDKKSVIFTMWETDYLDSFWVKHLNRADSVIVPSSWSVESFKKCGVTVPIYKVPLGCHHLFFNPGPNYPTECVFGTAAALNAGGLRKNTKHVVDLFQKAFPDNENVKLRVKITPNCPWEPCNDKRVDVTQSYLSPLDLAQWYQSTSAFVNCSYAEGFGLHLIESMACARPVIGTAYSAVTDYFDDSVGYVANHQIIQAKGGAYSGHWGKPDDNSIIALMQKVYNNTEEAKMKGEAAFMRAKNYGWKDTGRKLLGVLLERNIITL
jgi:glycosyltransferase involved in cell wall biosynthesis